MVKDNKYSKMVESRKQCSAEKTARVETAIKILQITHGKITAKSIARNANVSLAFVYKCAAFQAVKGNALVDDRRTSASTDVVNSICKQETDRVKLQNNVLREENKRLKEENQSFRSENRMLKNQLKVQNMDKLAEEFDGL